MDRTELGREIYRLSLLKGFFRLRSGQTSTRYFDKYQFEARPKVLNAISQHLLPLISENTEVLAGLELGGVPISTALSLETDIPMTFVRKKAKDYGTRNITEGVDVAGKKVCIVEDVVTSGGQIIESAKELRQLSAIIVGVLCVIERNGEGREKLLENGLELRALFTEEQLSR